MKKITLCLIMLAFSTSIFSQRIKSDEFDKFNKVRVIETYYETLFKNFNFAALNTKDGVNFALRKYGESYILLADIKNEKRIEFVEGNNMVLLLDNDSTVTMNNNYVGKATKSWVGRDVTANSFTTTFNIEAKDVPLLRNNRITAIRIRHASGSFDGNIKKNNQDLIQKMFIAIDKEESKSK